MDERIRIRLAERLEPSHLEVINESHLHAGHHGSPGTGESHYRVVVSSPAFVGLSRLARHRLVNEALAAELRDGVHALAIVARAPGEDIAS
ncbi:MAG: BolA/IbaG family iron-sulfur metabolism protein [Rhizobiales bacterium]|nr:BolA/IbaG family iron-sulfur metabolism protein [Hyphomicrobiales bacterium]